MQKRTVFFIFLGYLAITLLVFSPVIKAFFVSDDFDWINRVKSLSPLTHNYFLTNADGARTSGVYRPLTIFTFWLNYQIGGLNPVGYHFVNIFFHALNAFLVFYLLRLFLKSDIMALAAGAFFSVLPNHTEAVAWISGRGDALATFFYLLSLILYVTFRNTGSVWRLGASLGCFIFALFSKEIAITLPVVLLAYEGIRHSGQSKQIRQSNPPAGEAGRIKQFVLYLLPFFAALAGYFVLRFFATGLFYGFYATQNLRFSISRAFEMMGQSLLSNFFASRFFEYWLPAFVVAVILFVAFAAFLRAETRRAYIFGAIFFVVTLAPAFYLRFSQLTGEGERFVYLPSVGFVILLSALLAGPPRLAFGKAGAFGQKQKYIFSVLAALALAVYFGGALWMKNINWRMAGELSRALLFNFGQTVDLTKPNRGVVLLGLPDNFSGAQIFRNGWLSALALYYPFYEPDVLTVKMGLNLASNRAAAAVEWQTTSNGFIGESNQPIFYGPSALDSSDYTMRIKNYQKDILSGSAVEFSFTPEFKKRNEDKPIIYLVARGGRFDKLRPF